MGATKAPITAVFPLTATALPKDLPLTAPGGAGISCCSLHVDAKAGDPIVVRTQKAAANNCFFITIRQLSLGVSNHDIKIAFSK